MWTDFEDIIDVGLAHDPKAGVDGMSIMYVIMDLQHQSIDTRV